MDTYIEAREYGWTDSSDSDISDDLLEEELGSDLFSSNEDEIPFARHGPIVVPDPEEVSIQREFWSSCAIGFILDYKKISVNHLQQIINSAWRIRGSVSVVGRESYYYIIHFEDLEDLTHICNEGPWAVDGALLMLERWRPNLILSHLQLNYISVWVQLHGLPLEYQYPELAEKMGQMMGILEKVDWEDRLPRNICFMHIKVKIDPWLPVFSGFMLRLDDGSRVWIQCRYERIHKLCNRCGLIGHTRGQCTCSMDDIEIMLYRQRLRTQELHQVQYKFDALQPQFSNYLRASHNRRRRWTTQVCFGPILHNQAHASQQPHPTAFPNPSTPSSEHSYHASSPFTQPNHHNDSIHSIINLLNLNSSNRPQTLANPVPSQPIPVPPHVSPKDNSLDTRVNPDPINTITLSNIGNPDPDTEELNLLLSPTTLPTQHTPPPQNLNEPSFSMRPAWLPPAESNLRWTWIEGNDPFITNGQSNHP